MFKARSPHRSSCSRRARKERRPSTEIRLGVDSALGARKTSSTFFVLGKAFASERAPPERCQEESVGIPHPRLTRGAFTDKESKSTAWPRRAHEHMAAESDTGDNPENEVFEVGLRWVIPPNVASRASTERRRREQGDHGKSARRYSRDHRRLERHRACIRQGFRPARGQRGPCCPAPRAARA